ncbi:DNA primase [Patescibacteria group bacterium]|nr:DNA primase [Patescibacteria group bacterium]
MKSTDIIKDKLNILDVVGSYVKLEKAGKTYKGTSPFTNEKTPSFFVSPEKGFFYCFSSGKGGDIFTFIEEIERVDFKEALAILAEKAGVDLGKISLEDQTQEKRYYTILDDVTKWYEVHLRKNTEVVNYLTQRGLTKDTIVQFRIGFAIDDWRDAYRYLKSRKHTDADIVAAGLVLKKDGGDYYDRFRSRIMFPLFDSRGRVIGFSGRIFTDDPDVKSAKYINSPEGPLFDKSKVLYGYHIAKNAMAKAGNCILVEGQFDVLLAQQAGYLNTVAISGTGLTDDHVAMIKRFTDTVLLALDSDQAGIKATRRSVLAAYRNNMQVRVITLPNGMDPADTIAKSKAQWDVCVTDAKDYIDYRLELAGHQNLTFEQRKSLVTHDLFTFVYYTKSAMVQDRILQKLGLFLGVSVEAIRTDFAGFRPDQDDTITARPESLAHTKPSERTTSLHDDILFTYMYLAEKGYLNTIPDSDQIHQRYEETYGTTIEDDLKQLDETLTNMHLFVYEERYGDANPTTLHTILITKIFDALIATLKKQVDDLLYTSRVAESEGNSDTVRSITKDIQTTKERIETLIAQRDS